MTIGGPDTSTNVVVTDSLPAEVNYVSDDCGGVNGTPWTWTIGSLASGASATCNIVVQTTGPGGVSNTAEVTSDSIDPDLGNNSATAVVNVPPPTTTTSSTSSTTSTSSTSTTSTSSTSSTSTTSTTSPTSTTTTDPSSTSTPTSSPNTTAPGTDVGDTELDTLPLTGSSSASLLIAGIGLFALGAITLTMSERKNSG